MTASARGRAGRAALAIAVLGSVLAIWEILARRDASVLVPPASTVFQTSWDVWPTRGFLTAVGDSLGRLAAGFAVGAAVGVALGLLLGASRATRRTLEPFVEISRAAPPIALVPAAIVIFGLGDGMRIAVIAFGVCFPVLVNTTEGVRAVSPEARDTAAMLHLGPLRKALRVYLPAALPSIAAGLRVALPIGLVMVVISELVQSEGSGLGAFIRLQQEQFDVPELYSGILFLGLLGCALNSVFLLAERRLLRRNRGAAGEPAR